MATASPGGAPVGAGAVDDAVIPFRTVKSGVAGRIVRLGPAIDHVLTRHDYPEGVSRALGEALVLTALLGNPLKDGGRLIVQTKSDGPLGLLVTNYDAPGRLRGYASFDRARLALPGAGLGTGALLGKGHLAMTIDPGSDQPSYQGIVALDGSSLVDAAHAYFRQSEQLPTMIRIAVGRQFLGATESRPAGWRWRAGGLIVQHVPKEGGEPRADDERIDGEDDDNWVRVRLLAETAEDEELIDPLLSSERLLLRLFHEEGVRVTPSTPLAAVCRCSRQRIATFLGRFGAGELSDLEEADGAITVTCEFCSTRYRFEKGTDLAGEAG